MSDASDSDQTVHAVRLQIKSEGGNIFTFNAEEINGKPLEIALHTQYEGEAVFSGLIKVRFTLSKDSVSLQSLPSEDAS